MRAAISSMLIACSALALSACDVDKTQEGEMPNVNVEGGQVPKYDVDAPEVSVNKEERSVTVPDVDVDVNKEERSVTVPDVDVKPAEKD